MTALLEDGYEGQELYNALSVVLPGLGQMRLISTTLRGLRFSHGSAKKDSRHHPFARSDERVVGRSSDFIAFSRVADGVAVVSFFPR